MNIVIELLGYWDTSSLKSTQQMGNKTEHALLLTKKWSSFNVSLGAVYSFSIGLKFKENSHIYDYPRTLILSLFLVYAGNMIKQ